MNIGIDVSTLTKFTGGVNSYLINLIENLSIIDKQNNYFLYTHKPLEAELKVNNLNFKLKHNHNNHRLIWMQTQLPFILKNDKIDVLHSPCYLTPLISKVPSVLTIHDMTSKLFPESFVLKHRLIYGTFVPLAARKASIIIADSENTRKDIINLFKINGGKINTVHLGVGRMYSPKYTKEVVENNKKKYKIKGKYILCVSTIAPRKNLSRLLKAFDLLVKGKNLEHILVIAGKKGWMCGDVFRTHESLNLKDRVLFLDFVPENDLPLLYSGAGLFVFPSLYEGFGLPPLEAMACGVPVITSNTSCFPEILMDKAIMVDPYDINLLSEEMYRVISDSRLREQLIKNGLEYIKKFVWQDTAKKMLNVYNKISLTK